MEKIFAYPGSFTPPTYGHFEVVRRAAEIFPEVVIICSTNEKKGAKRWFSEEECCALWQQYALPQNVRAKTFTNYAKEKVDPGRIVMIRGIRDNRDLEHEIGVVKLNSEAYGIDKYFYILAKAEFADISSSRVRKAAEEFDFMSLAKCVPPAIITQLLEKVLDSRNLFMVVGKPGSGKSTFLKMLSEIDATNIHINTDDFSKEINPMLLEKFGQDTDLVTMAIERDREMTEFVAPLWFRFLAEALRGVPKNSNVFLEIPYGLKPGKELYRYVGHKVLYIGCGSENTNRRRINGRGTERHVRFIDEIPGLQQSRKIAKRNGLEFHIIKTDGSIRGLRLKAEAFMKKIDPRKEGQIMETISNENYLEKKFRAWFAKSGAQGDWQSLFQEIKKEYQKPERYYHTFVGHIAFCLRELDHFSHCSVGNIDALELALLLHDCVMDFMGADNEERSATVAVTLCQEIGLSQQFGKEVARLILATKHDSAPEDDDAKLVIDIDLAILGQEAEIFDKYEKNVRQEYAFVPEEIFRKKRAEILKHFLDRPSVFLTEYFQRKYEKQARENLKRSISKLEQ